VKIDRPAAVGLNTTVPAADVQTVVVGAGHAGLAASWALAERDVEHVILEEGRIGEVWRSARWGSFRLNTPRWMSRLPGQTVAGTDADGFDAAPEFAATLEEFARLHDLPVRQHAGAVQVEHGGDGRFTVRARDGDVRARSVILATGFQRVTARPPLSGALPGRLLQLDTATYRSPEEIADGAVLVVGGGQSGCQIAEDLAAAGRRVLLSTSRVAWVPRRYRGRDTVGWWTVTGFFAMRRADADDALLRQRQPLISGTDGGHSLSLHSLARRGIELLGRLEGGAGEELRFGDDVAEHARFADESSRQLLRDIDDHIERSGIDAPPAESEPSCAPLPGIGGDAPAAVRLDRAGVGTVIWCTGMRPRFDAVRIPGLLVDGGMIPHESGETAIPGLHLLGAPWMRRRKSGIVWGAPDDAEQVAAAIAGARAA
jgi:putative flavoprotein involved in K+ transport